ncbi:uncharacterized protein (DUF2225 family) [Peribacillus deserti]|uniref:Uncharacterized protein (DUF2225 family) n=1 Tax=Peribacillus deserti TaxID=673318 RepID=A0ABS2QMM8_9BACI|nr:DUF2225 domain-containing protein [Peribacillus deserti]MBM7694428.1 uncharacterized protein (DUF2225 family) [Peribacillus deserti]
MEQITPFFEKKSDCMFCGSSFHSMKLRSKFIKILSYDTDFRPIYSDIGINPLLYKILVCPHCGFSFSEEFSTSFPPLTKDVIREKVTSRWVPHQYGGNRTISDAIKTYKLASYCALLKKEKHITSAGLFLRIAWLYRETQPEHEPRFLALAQKEYEQSYSSADFRGTQVSEIKLLYIIGEISRRIGDFSNAARHLSMVIEKQKHTTETKIVEMAKDQWQQIRQLKAN